VCVPTFITKDHIMYHSIILWYYLKGTVKVNLSPSLVKDCAMQAYREQA